MGLREEKKKQTRKAISDMATQLFVERGYHAVTTAEIAERAKVSVPTLFNYFPTKESMVFDEDDQTEKDLVAIVSNRKKGQTIVNALYEAGIAHIDSIPAHQKKSFSVFMKLIDTTPELNAYAKQMWLRHEKSLAKAIRKEAKIDTLEAEAIARFVLDSFHRVLGSSQPKESLHALFKILQKGWNK
jgi:AcrR family transcriptional regulator